MRFQDLRLLEVEEERFSQMEQYLLANVFHHHQDHPQEEQCQIVAEQKGTCCLQFQKWLQGIKCHYLD